MVKVEMVGLKSNEYGSAVPVFNVPGSKPEEEIIDMEVIHYVRFTKDTGDYQEGDYASCIAVQYAEWKLEGVVEKITQEEFEEASQQNPPEEVNENSPEVKEALIEEKNEKEIESYVKDKVNWLEEDFWDNWDKVKGHSKKLFGHHEEYFKEEPNNIFFLAHSKNIIKGKPQLVEPVQKKIPLVKLSIKKMKDKETKEETELKKIFMFGERYDVRYDGYLKETLALDFWLYKVVSNDKDYYILSERKLPNEMCKFSGMNIELEDFAEMSRSLKIKSLSRVFILKDFEANVKILSREEMVQFTKEKKITLNKWIGFLGYHKFGNINRFPEEVELLRSSFILGGREHGYPNHLFIMGRSGTRKTVGHIETLSYKFSEEPIIIEGGDSRIKGLSPSFKEKPANIGGIAKANRVCFVDEIGKMIEFEASKHESTNTNILGELNFLLEQKYRSVGSGNDNDCKIQSTAKCLFPTNPIRNRRTIYDHVGLIDPTTLSRMIIWVQDDSETEFVMSSKGIDKIPPTPTQAYPTKHGIYIENRKKLLSMKNLWGACVGVRGNIWDIMSRDEFLTLFDTCYTFVSEIDESEVERLSDISVSLAKEPMKSSVWKPRASHHVKLLVDGLCKTRCLFKDYDSTFTANQEDYDMAERILVRMVQGWDTDLSPKEAFR